MQTKMLIGGAQEAGTETEEQVLNPRTGEVIVKMAEADMDQVNRAVAAARAAFPSWARTTPGHRSGLLLALADAVEARIEEFAQLEALNCGKPINEVRNEEVPAVADCFRFFAGAVRNMHGPLAGEYMEGHTSMIRRDPIGVVAFFVMHCCAMSLTNRCCGKPASNCMHASPLTSRVTTRSWPKRRPNW